MFKIGINKLEKIEVLKELADEFFRPSEYIMETVSLDDQSVGNLPYDVLINKAGDMDTDGAKRELYHYLTSITNEYPLWGTLTGVRPVKLAGELIESLGTEGARKRLKEYYLLSDSKIDEIISMYLYQVEALGKPSPNSVSVYIGIPFCPTRCLYCSFASNQVSENEIARYVDALKKEIKAMSDLITDNDVFPESIYIGGGTPTTLNEDLFGELLSEIRSGFDFSKVREFTCEAGRPDTINLEKLRLMKENGVERISINPQSMKAGTLELIGRNHTPEDIERAFSDAKAVGFQSINCDLIAGLPEEDVSDIEKTLDSVIGMGADNITVHCLAVKRASRLIEEDPDYHYKRAVSTTNMINYAGERLREEGYKPYYLYRQKHMAGANENTGYTIPGKEGLYNVRIMDEHQPILALGAGGISKKYYPSINRLERIPNVTNYEQYIDRIDEMIKRKENIFDVNK